MENYCICGKNIPKKWYLCRECYEKYGKDKTKWPEWLRFYTRDIHREIMYEYRHERESIFKDDLLV